jgi:Papain family cysteine protease
MNRVFNRHEPAPLPVRRTITRITPALPAAVDLRQWCGPIKDQGSEGSCTAHAGTSAVEWIFRKYFNAPLVFSPQYTYARELIAQGSFPSDVGSDGTTLAGTLITNGCCELSLFPYVPGAITRPTPEQDAAAANYTMGAFHGIGAAATVLSVLGDPVPWPVEIGFTVYESFDSPTVATSCIMSTPLPGERVLGGHEVVLVGYDVDTTPTLRPQGCPQAVLAQNSWGSGWGLEGFFWMPLSILHDPQTDLKIVHSGGPWK